MKFEVTLVLHQPATLRSDVLPRVRRALLVGLVLVVGGTAAAGRVPGIAGIGPRSAGSANDRATLLAILEHHHYRPFDVDLLTAAPVDAWPSILDDRHTVVVPADAVARRAAADAGGYVGIGLHLRAANDGTIVLDTVTEGSPAGQGGLRPGDELLAVDGRPVTGLDPDLALDLVRGPEGSAVTVTVRRPGAEVSVTTQRGAGPTGVAHADLYRQGGLLVGLVTVPELSVTVSDEVRTAVGDLTARGAEAFVLDLRQNPGGPVAEAVDLAAAFLPTGSTVAVERGRTIETTTIATRRPPAEASAPLVVLVDGLTAGTAEVVAGALADNDRATVVGTTTAGQGGLQDLYPLPDGTALKTTFAEYATPSGAAIDRDGITPDIAVADTAAGDTEPPDGPVEPAGATRVGGPPDTALDVALRAAAEAAGGPIAPAPTSADASQQG